MGMDVLRNYRALAVDQSVIREFGGTALFSEFLDLILAESMDIYVSRAFKLLHYCIIHQADDKNFMATASMKEFCGVLLPSKKLHTIQAIETVDYIRKVETLEDICIVTTKHSLFNKRLLEKDPEFTCDICILSPTETVVCHGNAELRAYIPKPDINPLASLNKYLDAPVYCNVGDIVITGNDRQIELSKRISNGAEGMVFTTNDPSLVAKIYHKGVITPLRWNKLTKMVSMGIKSVGICWPQDLLFYKGVPVGYTMMLGKGKTLGSVFDGPDAITNSFPKWTRLDVVDTIVDLLEKYIYLHMHDIVAGDIQLKNALIYSSASIYLIDMDSVQVGTLPCPVGTEDFTCPELWGRNFTDFLRSLHDEDYSIAMLVFSVLFCGLHPYATRKGAETLREEILLKNFPYTLDNSDEEHIPVGGYNYIWQYLPDYIREMLYGVFKEGRRYETIEWYESLLYYKTELSTHTYEDEEAYKVFPKMEYHMTAEATSVSDNGRPKTFEKPRFSGINGAGVSDNGQRNSNSVSNPPRAQGPFAPIGSNPSGIGPFATNGHRGNNAVPDASSEKKQESSSGLFGKLKKGLFN